MSKLTGYWYPKDSALREPAELLLRDKTEGECQLLFENIPVSAVGYLDALQVSDRVGNIPRTITLSDGSVFETNDNDGLDSILKATDHQAAGVGLLHIMETRWKWITTALVLTIILAFSFFKWGLPWGANKLAYSMPIAATQKLGDGVLELMDSIIFEPSALPKTRQEELSGHFQQLTAKLTEAKGFKFTFHFRQMMDLPNAMALPSGDIIVTDKLIEVAKNQQEIDAVVLHEIGHVVHRHGLQQVIQSTFVTVLLASVTGDISGSSDVLIAFPTFLLQSQYARHHEMDADDYAFKQMVVLKIDPKYFASIMQRMMDEERDEQSTEQPEVNVKGEEVPETKKGVSSYFASHPVTSERIKHALEYSAHFNASQQKNRQE